MEKHRPLCSCFVFPQLGCLACMQAHLASAVSTAMGKVHHRPGSPTPPFFLSLHSHTLKNLFHKQGINTRVHTSAGGFTVQRWRCSALQHQLSSRRSQTLCGGLKDPNDSSALFLCRLAMDVWDPNVTAVESKEAR